MPRDRDDKTGRFRESYPAGAFVEALEELGPSGTQDVADEVGCKYRTAHAKLSELEEEGHVTSRKVGNAKLWSAVEGEA
jgi:predicted ArsR family transcriptional regulator